MLCIDKDGPGAYIASPEEDAVMATTDAVFNLRVLIEFDGNLKYFVAHCLETGNVATATTEEMAKEMILEILHDEVAFALEHADLSNLFSKPAPLSIWLKWHDSQENVVEELLPVQAKPPLRINEKKACTVKVSKAA
jgi:hypothetical protein